MLPMGRFTSGKMLKRTKVCNTCDRDHLLVPFKAPVQSDMYWWNCKCGSTLVANTEDLNGREIDNVFASGDW